jgi:copper homeostasis protein
VIYEVCVDSLTGVRIAAAAKADRIELCADLSVGGLTPSIGTIERAIEVAGETLVHVLIRPRPGDFAYDADEILIMERDIARARQAGAAAVVVGALTGSRDVDIELTKRLIDGGPVTFHRAFDHVRDPYRALDVLITLGVDRVLTSGQQPTALDGAPLIARLHEQSGRRIAIMAGGGVNVDNAAQIVARTGVRELHFSGSEQRTIGGAPGRTETIAVTSRNHVRAIMAATTAECP